VTINDPSRNRGNDFRRTNSDSPELIVNGKIFFFFLFVFNHLLNLLDPFYSTTNNRATKTHPKKRSICKYSIK
jgi:hypothetical protein